MADCAHEQFMANVEVNRFEDTGKFMADIRVTCVTCGIAFRFLGVPSGLRFDQPMVSIDGTELRAPMEPEDEKLLHTTSSFQMPDIPKRN